MASGTPLVTAEASSNLIAGERDQQIQQQQQEQQQEQLHQTSGGKKELLNQFDAAEDSNGADMSSFIDLSASMDANSDTISRNSDSIYSINSTPEKLNMPSPAPNSDTLEEIVVISSEGNFTNNNYEFIRRCDKIFVRFDYSELFDYNIEECLLSSILKNWNNLHS